MKHLLIGITAAATLAAIGQAWAQIPPPGPQQAQLAPPAAYPLLNAPTPYDAYRQGQINRWELERLEGPLPQALQGPPVNGERGDSDGGRD
jgi:hypothetical protein